MKFTISNITKIRKRIKKSIQDRRKNLKIRHMQDMIKKQKKLPFVKKILLLIIIFLNCALSDSYGAAGDSQKIKPLIEAIKTKKVLKGETKDSIRKTFGYPMYRLDKPPQGKGKGEVWIYKPFKYGILKMKLTFENGKVISEDYVAEAQDLSEKNKK